MALGSILSDDTLARFRTKHCERLLVHGECNFADMCQYSHDPTWVRRNPRKHRYSSQFCSTFKLESCSQGAECSFAHSRDEQLYHPDVYKCAPCPGEKACGGYYCPFAHGEAELRRPHGADSGNAHRSSASPDHRRRGARQSRQHQRDAHTALSLLPQPSNLPPTSCSEASVSAPQLVYVKVDDFLEVALPNTSVPSSIECGARLAGSFGRSVLGRLRRKGADAAAAPMDCRVRLVPAGRKESAEAGAVCKEIKRWMTMPRGRLGSQAVDLRRTVATIYLALPPTGCPLDRCIASLGGGLRCNLWQDFRFAGQVAAWVGQLVEDLQGLHAMGIAHWCITPHCIILNEDGAFLGDFLGKIRAQHVLANGWDEAFSAQDPPSAKRATPAECKPDLAWAMWFPPEVHAAIGAFTDAATRSKAGRSFDPFAVDAWQLGVSVFYMLTGEHMFGDHSDPQSVCHNIVEGKSVNATLLSHLPVFANFCQTLTAQVPGYRPSLQMMNDHPLLWSLGHAANFLACVAPDISLAALNNLPCFAVFGEARVPAPMQPQLLERLFSSCKLAQQSEQRFCVPVNSVGAVLDEPSSKLHSGPEQPLAARREGNRAKVETCKKAQQLPTHPCLSESCSQKLEAIPESCEFKYGWQVECMEPAKVAKPAWALPADVSQRQSPEAPMNVILPSGFMNGYGFSEFAVAVKQEACSEPSLNSESFFHQLPGDFLCTKRIYTSI